MRILQIVGGEKPKDGSRENIFVHRQVNSLKALIPEMHILYAGKGSNPTDMTSLARQLRTEIKTFRPDVLHAQYGTVTGAVAVMSAGDVPTIVSFGGDEVYGTYINEHTTKSLRTSLALQFSKYCAKRANVCIAKNQEMGRVLHNWGAKRVEIIPNGVNLGVFREHFQNDCRAQLQLKPNIRYVVFAVRDNDYVKRRDLAEKAVNLYRIASSQEIELLILDNIDPELIPLYLNAGDVLLLCSNHEGSPNIVKEALACNRPVVSTDVGDVREQFGEVHGVYIVSQDPFEIAEGLNKAFGLSRSNGRKFVKHFSEEYVADRLVNLYKSVAK